MLLAAAVVTSALPALAVDAGLLNPVMADIPQGTDKFDERALLMGLLARPDEAAAFTADAKDAVNDPALKPLLVAKWRGRAASFAISERSRGGLDYNRTYADWKAVFGPEGVAYINARLKSMSKENSDKLVYYLGLLNQKLKENGNKVEDSMFSIANKIVAGVQEEYFKDIDLYLANPAVKKAKAGGPAAAQELAAAIAKKKAAPAAVPEPTVVVEDPAKKKPVIAPDPKTVVEGQPVEPPKTGKTAKEQLEAAERAGPQAGTVIDGGVPGKGEGDAVVVPEGGPKKNMPVLSAPSSVPAIAGAVPSPEDEDIDSRIAKSSSAKKPMFDNASYIAAGVGAVLGGLLGFLIGGPIGAVIGAAVLGGAGYMVANKFH